MNFASTAGELQPCPKGGALLWADATGQQCIQVPAEHQHLEQLWGDAAPPPLHPSQHQPEEAAPRGRLCSSWAGKPTFEGHVSPGFQVHLAVPLVADPAGVVADAVAAVLAAAQADPLLEAAGIGALERKALLVLVHQGVHEEVHRPLVLTLNNFTNC